MRKCFARFHCTQGPKSSSLDHSQRTCGGRCLCDGSLPDLRTRWGRLTRQRQLDEAAVVVTFQLAILSLNWYFSSSLTALVQKLVETKPNPQGQVGESCHFLCKALVLPRFLLPSGPFHSLRYEHSSCTSSCKTECILTSSCNLLKQ